VTRKAQLPEKNRRPGKQGAKPEWAARLTNIAKKLRLMRLGNTGAGPAGLRCLWVELSYAASASLPGGFSLLRMRSGAPWLNPRPAPFLALKKMHAMKKPFTVVAVVIFAIVAIMHLLRLLLVGRHYCWH